MQAAVKVHTPFRFPATLYMDRYLEEHRDQVSDKRQHVAQLRKEIEQLQASLSALNKFTHPASNLSAEQAVAKDEYIAGVLALLKVISTTPEDIKHMQHIAGVLTTLQGNARLQRTPKSEPSTLNPRPSTLKPRLSIVSP